MPNDKDELQEQKGSLKNNDQRPIGVDEKGNPVVPPNIDKRGDGSGEQSEVKKKGENDTGRMP